MTTGTDVSSFKNHRSLTPSHERHLSLFHTDPSPPTEASDPEATQVHGKVVRLNGHELALFCYKDKLYAVTEKCPHMGRSTIQSISLHVACVRPRMYINQNSWLGTATESKATSSSTILWGSMKLHAKNLRYASPPHTQEFDSKRNQQLPCLF